MKLLIALIASALFVSACSLQQDPLAGSGSQVNSGNLPDTNKPVAKKPLPKDYLQLDYPMDIKGRVGAPLEVKLSGRILTPDVQFEIEILNLDLYEGATFDPATGIFTWTPTRAAMGPNLKVQFPLRVMMYTHETATSAVSSEEWTLPMNVELAPSKPTVISVKSDSIVNGGQAYRITFSVDDIDARDKNDIRVIATDCPSSVSYGTFAPFVEVQQKSFTPSNTPGRYEGAVVLNLRQTDGVKPAKYCFGLMAVSYIGIMSDVTPQIVTYEPELKNSKIVIDDNIDVNIGETKNVYFTIYDPLAQADLVVSKMTDLDKLLPGSKMDCKTKSNDKSMAYCSAFIDARQATDERSYRIEITADTMSRNDANRKLFTYHGFRINVKKAVVNP